MALGACWLSDDYNENSITGMRVPKRDDSIKRMVTVGKRVAPLPPCRSRRGRRRSLQIVSRLTLVSGTTIYRPTTREESEWREPISARSATLAEG
jgi:hypothetical protein